MRSSDEIASEIATLTEMKPRVRQFTAFGDDNHAAIEFQINVLSEPLSNDDIYDELPNDNEDQHVRDAALEALAWMQGEPDKNAPSSDWASLASGGE